MAAQKQPEELDDLDTIQFTVRMNRSLLAQLDHHCQVHGVKSRNELLNLIVASAMEKGFLPIRDGEGLKATIQGLAIVIRQDGGIVTSGSTLALEYAKEIYQTAYRMALEFAQVGNWQAAKDTLETVGFNVTKLRE